MKIGNKKIFALHTRTLHNYNSIEDLPIYNWRKINQLNDLTYLLKVRRAVSGKEVEQLQKIWQNIFDEFIDTFGVPEYMKEVLTLRRDIECMKVEMYIERDRTLSAIIQVKEDELKALIGNDKIDNVNETTAHIEKYLGFQIDENKVSVKKYYTYVKMLEKFYEQKRSATNKTKDID